MRRILLFKQGIIYLIGLFSHEGVMTCVNDALFCCLNSRYQVQYAPFRDLPDPGLIVTADPIQRAINNHADSFWRYSAFFVPY